MPKAAARPVPCWTATRMIVSVGRPSCPGPRRCRAAGSSSTASQLPLCVGEHADRRRAARLAGAETLDEGELPGVRGDVARQRRHAVGERAVVAHDVARLLIREDALEHVVASHRDVARGDVRGGRQRHESCQSGPPAPRPASRTAKSRNASSARSTQKAAIRRRRCRSISTEAAPATSMTAAVRDQQD